MSAVVYRVNGRTVSRDEFLKGARGIAGPPMVPSSNWRLISESMGVNPKQVKEAQEHSRRIGVPTEFTKDGCAIFRSRRHRKEYCEKLGYFDKDGGYGDPQRKGLQ